MYAVIANGGKQYRVKEGDLVELEKIAREPGSVVEFSEVLLLQDDHEVRVGAPYLSGVKVTGEIIDQIKGEKVRIIKFRRRKHFMKSAGHRQKYTQVKITKINP